jgi:hypothetical protein
VHESNLLNLPYATLFFFFQLSNLDPLTPLTEKTTWWGCGAHIPAVLDSVPESERCTCTPKVERDGKEYPPKGSH